MKKSVAEVLEQIAKDQKDDATKFEGQPFNGRTVATYFGNQGAAIAALADILKTVIEDDGK
jgi:hypothetical protein